MSTSTMIASLAARFVCATERPRDAADTDPGRCHGEGVLEMAGPGPEVAAAISCDECGAAYVLRLGPAPQQSANAAPEGKPRRGRK